MDFYSVKFNLFSFFLISSLVNNETGFAPNLRQHDSTDCSKFFFSIYILFNVYIEAII